MDEFIWTRKYAPQSIDDLILSDENKETFNSNFNLKESSNLLFIGKAGVGKTTLAKLLSANYDYIYINASDSSGIDTIRNEVTDFIKTSSILGDIKVVILDEADGLSSVGGGGTSAQQALRNMMEENLDSCRFILTANYEHKIIEPLRSRCQTFRFNLTTKECAAQIVKIAKAEGISVDKEGLLNLLKTYAPDLRKCINEFQKGSKNGKFVFPVVKYLDISGKIKKCLEGKVSVFDIRESIIKDEDSFESNYLKLIRGLFDLYCVDRNVKAVESCCYHMEKDAIVMDKEVNFTSLLLSLSKLY